MAYELVTEPIPASEAFRTEGARAYQSQAAVLLTLGGLMHYEDGEPPGFRALAVGEGSDVAPADDLESLGFKHSASHDPAIWASHNLPHRI
jgi:hypothetical protein